MTTSPTLQPRILLLEDDPAIARSTIYALEREGFRVTHSLLLADARQQLRTALPDMLVLDVGLPDGNGLDLCRELRATGTLPILVLSARGEEIDRVLGLELGADDYLTKPFSPRELVARIRGILRRLGKGGGATAAAPSLFRVDTEGQRIEVHGQALELTRLEFKLLMALLGKKGRICSRDNLLTSVWGDASTSTERTVDTHIKTLRAKLLQACPHKALIVTHRGMGYSIEAD